MYDGDVGNGAELEGDTLLRRLTSEPERARQTLHDEIMGLPRYSTRNRRVAPQAPGVYFMFRAEKIVYVGSSGHGKVTDSKGRLRRGLRRRLLMEFTRTRMSPIRQGIATELGRSRYKARTKAETDSSFEGKINEQLKQLDYAFRPTSSGEIASRLERRSIDLLRPKFNRRLK